MKTPHALVIDDQENILADIRARLDSKGHTYVTAKSQDEAEQLIDSTATGFDYILLGEPSVNVNAVLLCDFESSELVYLSSY